jgi:hypothetical protein
LSTRARRRICRGIDDDIKAGRRLHHNGAGGCRHAGIRIAHHQIVGAQQCRLEKEGGIDAGAIEDNHIGGIENIAPGNQTDYRARIKACAIDHDRDLALVADDVWRHSSNAKRYYLRFDIDGLRRVRNARSMD